MMKWDNDEEDHQYCYCDDDQDNCDYVMMLMSCWCCWNLRTRVHPPWSPSVTVTSSPSWNMLSEEILKFGISRQVCRSHIAIDDNDKWEDDDQIEQPEGPCCSQLLRNKNKVRCSVLRLRWRNPPPTWDIQSQRKNRQHPHISVKGSLSDTYTFTLLHYKKAPLLFGCPIPKWKLTPSPHHHHHHHHHHPHHHHHHHHLELSLPAVLSLSLLLQLLIVPYPWLPSRLLPSLVMIWWLLSWLWAGR